MSFKSNIVNTSSLYEIPNQNISISVYEEAKDINSFNIENFQKNQNSYKVKTNAVTKPISETEIALSKEAIAITPLLEKDNGKNNTCCLNCLLF